MSGCECGLCSASRGDPTLEHINAVAQQLDDGGRAVLRLTMGGAGAPFSPSAPMPSILRDLFTYFTHTSEEPGR
jgi:hypothetical protein